MCGLSEYKLYWPENPRGDDLWESNSIWAWYDVIADRDIKFVLPLFWEFWGSKWSRRDWVWINSLFILELIAIWHAAPSVIWCDVCAEVHRDESSWCPQSARGGPELPEPSIGVWLLVGAAQQDHFLQQCRQFNTGLGAEFKTQTGRKAGETTDSRCPFPCTQVFLRSVEEALSSPVLPEVNEFLLLLSNPKYDTMRNMQLAWCLRDPWDFNTAPSCAKSTSSSRETVCPHRTYVLRRTQSKWPFLSALNVKVQSDPTNLFHTNTMLKGKTFWTGVQLQNKHVFLKARAETDAQVSGCRMQTVDKRNPLLTPTVEKLTEPLITVSVQLKFTVCHDKLLSIYGLSGCIILLISFLLSW